MQILLIVFASCYAVPLCRFIISIFKALFGVFSREDAQNSSSKILKNRFLTFVSNVEFYSQALRFYFVGLPIIIFLFYNIYLSLFTSQIVSVNLLLSLVGLSFLVIYQRDAKVSTDVRLAEILRTRPNLHPLCFYGLYRMQLALGIGHCSSEDEEEVKTYYDYRKNERSRHTGSFLIPAIFDTMCIAHLGLSALDRVGEKYLFEMVDDIYFIWGKRMLQLAQGSFSTKGLDRLEGKEGKFILIYNHKSSFDFMLGSLGFARMAINDRSMRPRFLVAKDHFKDNHLIYRVFGVGRLCEAIKMIFIERKNHKMSVQNLEAAAKKIAHDDIDIAIYPQGTRSDGNYDRAGKRRDAGYYTTITKRDLTSPLAHLKKGTAYLVFNALRELYESKIDQNLNLVFVGIKGAGTTLPKGRFKVQTENEIEFSIGEVVTISPQVIEEVLNPQNTLEQSEANKQRFILQIHGMINDELKNVLQIHESLKQRFLTELRGQFRYDAEKIQRIQVCLEEFSHDNDSVFQILDLTYSLPLSLWNGYLSELSQVLLERPDHARMEALLEDVAKDFIHKKRKK
jgi:1-acyl-sn-glycerol-3-phosphate acyltransferase